MRERQWNAATSGTLGAWDFGDSNQLPALRYDDYDGTGTGTDYCGSTAGLFITARNPGCGVLLPGQRTATTPQIGTTPSDIRLTEGDTLDRITANVTLPARSVANGNTVNLMWSVHRDPEANPGNRVTISGGMLQVNDNSRASTRWIILRAMSGSTTVNDYRLRIVQIPNLRLTSTVGTLEVNATHTFAATSDNADAPITWSVTAADGSTTSLATIDAISGLLTARAPGSVRVTATVAESNAYGSDTISHTVSIPRLPENLVFSDPPARMRVGSDQTQATVRFSVTQDGTGAITWSIVEGTAAATIDSRTGVVTAGTTGETVTVQATVAETSTHAAQTITTPLIIAVDFDGDGLIEIYDLTMLHNMRHNLAGTSYKTGTDATGITTGCPDATPDDSTVNENCTGYELMNDLDFDRDGDGTWNSTTFALDSNDSQTPWFDTADGGWLPIGDGSNPFAATFEGNGFVIRNLAIRRNQSYIGLFGRIHNATIRNLGLENALADYTGI